MKSWKADVWFEGRSMRIESPYFMVTNPATAAARAIKEAKKLNHLRTRLKHISLRLTAT